jgi:TadE-like protein
MMRLIRHLLTHQSGAALVEATLVMPIAISLMAGGVEFGQIFLDYGTANKSMRDAARYLARVPSSGVCGWGLTNAQNIAVYGSLSSTGTPLISGWQTSTVSLQSPNCGGGSPAFSSCSCIHLNAAVPYSGSMLGALGLSNSLTLTVNHEEPYVGE